MTAHPEMSCRSVRKTTGVRDIAITDDNLWRPTRRAEEDYTKNKLSTRRGAVHSIGWLSARWNFGRRCIANPTQDETAGRDREHRTEQYSDPSVVNNDFRIVSRVIAGPANSVEADGHLQETEEAHGDRDGLCDPPASRLRVRVIEHR